MFLLPHLVCCAPRFGGTHITARSVNVASGAEVKTKLEYRCKSAPQVSPAIESGVPFILDVGAAISMHHKSKVVAHTPSSYVVALVLFLVLTIYPMQNATHLPPSGPPFLRMRWGLGKEANAQCTKAVNEREQQKALTSHAVQRPGADPLTAQCFLFSSCNCKLLRVAPPTLCFSTNQVCPISCWTSNTRSDMASPRPD